jgi:polysaccharide export outer membrane protein
MRLKHNINDSLRFSLLILSLLGLFLQVAQSYAEPSNEKYIVKSGDVLGKVAQKYQTTGVSLKKVMDDIYTSNIDAFVKGDRHQLIIGSVIQIPYQALKQPSPVKSTQSGLLELANAKQKTNEVYVALDAQPIEKITPLAKKMDDYVLASGDKIHIQVFDNPDLTLDVIVSAAGGISFPLIGEVDVNELSSAEAAQKIAEALSKGGFINNPQVSLNVTEVVGSKITLLGFVNKPGVYPLSKKKISIGEALALAGGIVIGGQYAMNKQNLSSAGDVAILSGTRNGAAFIEKVNLNGLLNTTSIPENFFLIAGDLLYVPAAPTFYIYGEVKEPGNRKIELNMNVLQALAVSGGLTLRGTQRNIKVFRKNAEGVIVKHRIRLTDLIQADDVLYVEESIF